VLVDWFRRLRPDYAANKRDATEMVDAEVARLRALSYEQLVALMGSAEHREMALSSGVAVVLETQVFWDAEPGHNIRVMVDVWRPDIPNPPLAISDFIRAPTGGFVDE
jgi:hypothetical protein